MSARFVVSGTQAIEVAAGRYVPGEIVTLTPHESSFLQRAGAVSPLEEGPASAGLPHSRATAGLPTTTSTPADEE
jgi:hypothetical protein